MQSRPKSPQSRGRVHLELGAVASEQSCFPLCVSSSLGHSALCVHDHFAAFRAAAAESPLAAPAWAQAGELQRLVPFSLQLPCHFSSSLRSPMLPQAAACSPLKHVPQRGAAPHAPVLQQTVVSQFSQRRTACRHGHAAADRPLPPLLAAGAAVCASLQAPPPSTCRPP